MSGFLTVSPNLNYGNSFDFIKKYNSYYIENMPKYDLIDAEIYSFLFLYFAMKEVVNDHFNLDFIHLIPIDGPLGKFFITNSNYAAYMLYMYDVMNIIQISSNYQKIWTR